MSIPHVSIRRAAFRIELEDIDKAKEWLQEWDIDVVNFYEFEPAQISGFECLVNYLIKQENPIL